MRIFLLTLPLLGLMWAARASAEDATTVARGHFRQGAKLYKQAQYREAIAEFEAAYRAKPHGVILYNLAQCYEKLGEIPAALHNYQEYLRQVPDAQDRGTVEAVIANLQRRLAERGVQQLQVRSEPSGAAVAIDGEARGQTPYAGEHALGPHQVEVSLPGYEPIARQVVLTPELSVQLDLTLAHKAPPPSAPPEAVSSPAPPPPSRAEVPRRWTWLAAGTAGAALAGAVTLGLLAQQSSHALLTSEHDRTRADALYQAALSQSRGANVLYGLAGAAAGTAGALFFIEGRF